jgi:transketolase C-terminal domain/subunit
MERGNFSAAAGFGFERGRQGIFSTFSAFMEMVISEITMARLNHSNVLCHFAHAGVDDMADNTCHFGINNLFADNGLPDGDNTALYFPADRHQFRAVLSRIFFDPGIRFIFSTRSSVPDILASDGSPFYAGDYAFEPGRDDIIRRGTAGYIVSYGEMLYRSLDAVERLREEGIDIGLVNKTHLNFPDEAALREIGGSDFVLVVETQSVRTGLGSRLGSYLLERGYRPKFAHLGVTKAGDGGLGEQVEFQGLGVDAIMCRVRELLR